MTGRTMAGWAAAMGLASAMGGCTSVATLAAGGQIATTPRCTDFFFSVYFAGGADTFTNPARTVIRDAGQHTRSCTVAGVEVVGLSDYRGLSEANLALSRRRADRVAAALSEAGLPAPAFRLSAAGEAGAISDEGAAKPMRRRVNVTIRFAH